MRQMSARFHRPAKQPRMAVSSAKYTPPTSIRGIGEIVDGVEIESGDDDPADLLAENGSVNAATVFSDGIGVGQVIIPWPTLPVWGVIQQLTVSLELFMTALALLDLQNEEEAQAVLSKVGMLKAVNRIGWFPTDFYQLPRAILYLLAYPLHVKELKEELALTPAIKWIHRLRLRKELAVVSETPTIIKKQYLEAFQDAWLKKQGLFDEAVTLVNEVVPWITKRLGDGKLKKAVRLA